MELLIAIVIAWVAVGGDPKSLRASRGAVGMARAAGSGARSHVRAERARTAPARAQARADRHKKLAESGRAGRARVHAENGAAKVGHGIAGAARAGVAAVKAAPSGYAPAAEAATQKRAANKAARAKRKEAKAQARQDARAAREARFRMTPLVPEPRKDNPTPEEKPVTVAIRTTELETVADLRAEAQRVQDQFRQSIDALHEYAKWARDLPERLAEAPFGTRALASAVGAISETAPDTRQLLGTDEALEALMSALRSAQDIADVIESQGATGKTEAYVA
jgi:hypothetical protein